MLKRSEAQAANEGQFAWRAKPKRKRGPLKGPLNPGSPRYCQRPRAAWEAVASHLSSEKILPLCRQRQQAENV